MNSLPISIHSCEKSEAKEVAVQAQSGIQGYTRIPIRGPVELRRGSRVEHFIIQLPEVRTSKIWTMEDFDANHALLVMFICNHCPYVEHLKKDIVKLANCYVEKGLGVMAISSNSDGPECMAEEARLFDYPFPYLYDESQDVARAFSAVCTPEFFLFKKDDQESFELVYHGQFDDSRPCNNVPVTGRDLRNAIECVLDGLPVPSDQKPCIGCAIKWHSETAAE